MAARFTGIIYLFIVLLLCVSPSVGISQGEAVYLGQHVDIGNVIGWSSEIAWNGGYAPPSAGSSPVVIRLPGSLQGKANYYIDPAVFGKYPGRWYKWDGGSFTSPKENTIVFNIGNLPEEPQTTVATSTPTVTVGPTPRGEVSTTTSSNSGSNQGNSMIIVGITLVVIFAVAGFIGVFGKGGGTYTPPEPIYGGGYYVGSYPEPEPKIAPPLTSKQKEDIKQRDNYRCRQCGCGHALEVHHKVRRADGGSNDSRNLVTLCANCHSLKHK